MLAEPGNQLTSASKRKYNLKVSKIMPSFPLTALEFEVKKNEFVSVTVNGLKRTWWDVVHLENDNDSVNNC